MAEMDQRQGRPAFIPREVFRQWMTGTQMNKLMEVDGIRAASYISRAERAGRPFKKRGTLCRPIDVVARARAAGHRIEPPKAERLKASIEELEAYKAKLDEEIAGPRHEMEMQRLSMNLTDRILLSEKEIVECSAQAPHLVGVYFLVKGERVVYVGQSTNILTRIATHQQAKDFDRFAFVPCAREDLDVLESLYIHGLRPAMNGRYPHDDSHQAPLSLTKLVGIKKARLGSMAERGD